MAEQMTFCYITMATKRGEAILSDDVGTLANTDGYQIERARLGEPGLLEWVCALLFCFRRPRWTVYTKGFKEHQLHFDNRGNAELFLYELKALMARHGA